MSSPHTTTRDGPASSQLEKATVAAKTQWNKNNNKKQQEILCYGSVARTPCLAAEGQFNPWLTD